MLSLEKYLLMLSDKAFYDFEKMLHKYGKEELPLFIEALSKSLYVRLPLKDFGGGNIVILPCKINLTSQLKKSLLKTYFGQGYGLEAMESEIMSTLAIERIDTTREGVRRILAGGAPRDDNEKKAYGLKRGLDYISDVSNRISEDNLRRLYQMAVGEYLGREEELPPGRRYRNGPVYVVGDYMVHEGLPAEKLTSYMADFIGYINNDDELDQITKSVVIHYYIAYLHPYFDGNGRIARLLQLWYLVQKGYSQALYTPFSAFIQESKSWYYKAFTRISDNIRIAGVLDVTPFALYFIEHVLAKLETGKAAADVTAKIQALLEKGVITVKEKELIDYVLSRYGRQEFSTKQLEKDFGNAAYATIRSFVLKFAEYGIFGKAEYGARVRYRVK